MDIEDVKIKRIQKVIEDINTDINDMLIGFGWKKVIVNCPDDLYEDIKSDFESKGFKFWRERFEYQNMDGWNTGEYGFNYFIGI